MQDKDNLVEFIKDNKLGFDLKEPREQVWSQIQGELNPQLHSSLWYWKAAVILLIGAVGFLLIDKFSPDLLDNSTVSEEEFSAITNLQKFEELEVFYSSIISNKREKVSEELATGEAFNYLDADLKQLDLIYRDLKGVFLERQQSEEVLDRLVHLLRQKIHLLNSQLDILERDKMPTPMTDDLGVSM